MPRAIRPNVGGMVYHVLNRASARAKIFRKKRDYIAFLDALIEAKEKHPMRILAYCIMPNHWHLVLYPREDGQLSNFMHWLSVTHTQRWHAAHNTSGTGHVYQGRYKSFVVQTDEHFLHVCKYVERNPLRAGLVRLAETWQWSSLWCREYGSEEQKSMLSAWPVGRDVKYKQLVNAPQPQEEVEVIRLSVIRGRPFGDESWTNKSVAKLGLQSTMRSIGRPRKN